MSMDRCCKCNRPVDTDMDTDCYQPDPRHSLCGHPDICVCEPCRDEQEDDGEIDFANFKPLDQSLAELRAQEEMDTL